MFGIDGAKSKFFNESGYNDFRANAPGRVQIGFAQMDGIEFKRRLVMDREFLAGPSDGDILKALREMGVEI